MDDGIAEEAAGGVDGCPAVSGAGDAEAGEARPFQGGEEGGASGDAVFTIVREQAVLDVVAVSRFAFAEFRYVPVEGEAVGRYVVQEVEFAVLAGLDKPDGHEIGYADVPGCIDGGEDVRLEFRCQAPQFPEVIDLGTKDGSRGDGVERFIGNRGIFLPHEVALGAGHGFVPGFLLVIQGDGVIFFQ